MVLGVGSVDRIPAVRRIVHVGGVEVATVNGMPGVPLATPPASTTAPVVSPVITAASLAPVMVMVIACAVPSTVVTVKLSVQRLPGIERLHGGIGCCRACRSTRRRQSAS